MPTADLQLVRFKTKLPSRSALTSVKVDLHDSMSDGRPELLDTRARSAMEHEEDRLGVLILKLLGHKLLVFAEEVGLELDISRLVDTVDITEASGDAEVGRDRAERLVDVPDVLGLRVEGVVVNVLVVDTILLAAGDANLHLEPLLPWRSTCEVLGSGLDVVVDALLRKIDHVAAEQRDAVFLEEGLIRVHHTIQPRKQLLGAVVGMQNDGDAVGRGNGTDEVSRSNGAGDGCLLVLVRDALASEEGRATVGYLEDDRGASISGTFQGGVDS